MKHKNQDSVPQALDRDSQSSLAHPSRTIVHAKLEMTEPGDHDEQEADAVANAIVSGGKISRKISGGGGSSGIAVSQQMESQLSQLQGGGRQMPEGLRNMMESGFGQDFSQVRLHTDSEAANMSSSIHAKAFTLDNDIYFNQGQFSPNTAEGQRLVAHELTHVVQGTGKVGRWNMDDPRADLFGQTVVGAPDLSNVKPPQPEEDIVRETGDGPVRLLFDGIHLSIIVHNEIIASFNAYSGKGIRGYDQKCFPLDKESQKKPNFGPAPEGKYIVNINEIHSFVSFFENPIHRFRRWPGGTSSWGKERVAIKPTFHSNRSGLTIHGGSDPGSRGCIDLLHNEVKFFELLRKYTSDYGQEKVELDVNYNGLKQNCIPAEVITILIDINGA